MISVLRKNKLLLIVAGIYLFLLVFNRDIAKLAWENTTYYLIEMAQILPVIFLLTVAIEVLVPKEWIVKRMGNQSGITGMILALAFGSLSAGPIYAAFPIAKTLHQKGASVGNVVVILSAWAVIKVPMLANEAKFLGPEFMLVRWILTVIFILGMGIMIKNVGIKIQGEDSPNEQAIAIQKDYCIGCTACVRSMPDVFEMKDGKATVICSDKQGVETLVTKREELVTTAQKCPSKAIILKE
ncbi:permease [Eubacteriaceae bacterium ES3]|nr:permease [Eubacteriaceae bacterium ES3]